MTARSAVCSCGTAAGTFTTRDTTTPAAPPLTGVVCPHCDRECRTAAGFCTACQALDRAKRR